MTDTDRLPVFPLGTVLFPGEALPLQLFEPRYLQMMRDLARLPPADRRFGVVSLRKGHEVGPEQRLEVATIGTAARIVDIAQVPGGPAGVVLVVETVGESRFRLEGLDLHQTPYHVGDVTWLDDQPGDPEMLVQQTARAREAYRSFTVAMTGEPHVLDVPDDRLAYAIAASMPLPVSDRQAVLDCSDAVSRLALVTRLLRRESGLAGRLRMVPAERHRFAPPSSN